MKILIMGSGLIGPAAAFNAMSDQAVTQVTICDMSQTVLEQTHQKLSTLPGSQKLTTVALDLNNQADATKLMAEFDAIVTALPKTISPLAIRLAAAAGTPLVDLTRPSEAEVNELKPVVEAAGGLIILACGLEPGLTEIMARHLAEKLDRVDELHIKCGGIPENPAPPLNYKIVFGGRHLPLRDLEARIVENGELKAVPRYSGVEPVHFSGVGECEAWHEGFMPWLLELPALQNLRLGTQKTIRWPGYAQKVTVLKEMGLLSTEPVEVDGLQVKPKHLLDAVLYPKVKLAKNARVFISFVVEVIGQKDGFPRRYTAQMVDRYNEQTGMTSMARTTGYTGAIVARMIASGLLKAQGIFPPEQLITGPLFDKLINELAAVGIEFEMTTEKVEIVRG